MRELKTLAVTLAVAMVASGCAAFRDREWGTCAIAGAVVGATVGGITGGVATNNSDPRPANASRGAAIGGGVVGGALVGALLGHVLCDPEKQAPPPPPPPPPPPAPYKLETLRGPHFDFDKYTLRPTGKEKVEHAVKVLQEKPNLRARVEGHTDSIGTEAYNLKLSERRANAVRDFMIEKGISPSRITAVGLGKGDPVASNDTEEGRAQNRRVEIIAE